MTYWTQKKQTRSLTYRNLGPTSINYQEDDSTLNLLKPNGPSLDNLFLLKAC